jgi:hypothetical protein
VGEASAVVSDGVAKVVGATGIQVPQERFERGLDDIRVVIEKDVPLLMWKLLICELESRDVLSRVLVA